MSPDVTEVRAGRTHRRAAAGRWACRTINKADAIAFFDSKRADGKICAKSVLRALVFGLLTARRGTDWRTVGARCAIRATRSGGAKFNPLSGAQQAISAISVAVIVAGAHTVCVIGHRPKANQEAGQLPSISLGQWGRREAASHRNSGFRCSESRLARVPR